ncbi:MAG: hypothetical protein LBH42_04475, partial [Treponema sp.]|nr:hypothetical protein [Treponema sp.]
PKIEKVLLGKSLWQRQGIYLTVEPLNLNARRQVPAMEREEYEAMFRRFLEGGFLIPPSPLEPLILPGSMSPGEESKLAKLLASPNNM